MRHDDGPDDPHRLQQLPPPAALAPGDGGPLQHREGGRGGDGELVAEGQGHHADQEGEEELQLPKAVAVQP